ncbi:ThuA domain-containing protein [Dyadobacter luticola]|uniref:ThuA domain-containing protein n=1 Tax=Dyadobacter luticola TaxID=1979387 RepID=A0A5R9KSA9_9BACT|nr:ThuA domain-containing protein [Dyadobacter luticola]TLU99162.1 ThuA domain-containing protein [Dyadobacter luticola]
MKNLFGKFSLYLLVAVFSAAVSPTFAQKFRVLAMAEPGGHHIAYSKVARVWLDSLAAKNDFAIDYIENTDPINDAYLSNYQLIIQLDYVPYAWKPEAVSAFEKYIKEGKGGWIGFHHATLLGEFDGYKIWPWFSDFMGGIRYKNYIADFAAATVKVENKKHPVMKGIPASFPVKKEEWYIYDKSPRPNVEVLASVDESTYSPDSKIKMGDHPVIWSNPKVKARNVYIFMGHSPVLFESADYKRLFTNAIFWAAKK